jgi:hypothetical protein
MTAVSIWSSGMVIKPLYLARTSMWDDQKNISASTSSMGKVYSTCTSVRALITSWSLSPEPIFFLPSDEMSGRHLLHNTPKGQSIGVYTINQLF